MMNELEHLLEPAPTLALGILCLATALLGIVRMVWCRRKLRRCGLYTTEWVGLIVFWIVFGVMFIYVGIVSFSSLEIRSMFRALFGGVTLLLFTSHLIALLDKDGGGHEH